MPIDTLAQNLSQLRANDTHKSFQMSVVSCAEIGAGALLVTALDEVAWLLNLVGGDVTYNPVFSICSLCHTTSSNTRAVFDAEVGAGALLVTALDEVAWLLNLRGGDVSYNPVFVFYVVVPESTATLYVDRQKVSISHSYIQVHNCLPLSTTCQGAHVMLRCLFQEVTHLMPKLHVCNTEMHATLFVVVCNTTRCLVSLYLH